MELSKEQEKALKYEYQKRIFCYLSGRITEDKDLAEAIKNPKKTIDGVINYIKQQARKQAQNGVAVIPDDTVFNWCVHYILEDELNCEEKKSAEPEEDEEDEHEEVPAAKEKAKPESKKTKSIEEQMQDFYAEEGGLFSGLGD